MASEKCVTIIGGGFSGTLTAVQLIRQSPFPVSVRLINTGYPVARGVAYSAENNLHLLNVRSGRMSAFPHLPLHFVNWLETQPEAQQYCLPGESLADAFMPRKLFGRYLAAILDHTLQNLPAGSHLKIVEDEVTDIQLQGENKYRLALKNNPEVLTDKLVLALGNFPPANLPGLSPEILNSNFYFGNPWLPEVLENLDNDKPVLLIGSGLTMVDVALSLLDQNFTGKIITVSPKGYLPMIHIKSKPYPDIRADLQPPYTLENLYGKIKSHIRKAVAQGSSCEALIDTMRSKTQQIWQGLSVEDKQKFLRHLSSLWGVFRHRLSPQIAAKIQTARDSGQLEVIAGRMINAEVKANKLEVTIKEKGSLESKSINVQRLINCTGPQTNYSRLQIPVVQSLLRQQLISPDSLALGLNALPDGRLLKADNKPSCSLFTIGPTLRGVLWESTAVPEISEQAAMLAQTIIQSFMPETKTENTAAQTKK